MNQEEQWMRRALALAAYGRGNVSPNPMVGCVIVHQGQIIGEGWHRQYGGPHAEVWAVRDAERRGNGAFLPESSVYVTLEPCSHTGKTPPCADLLISRKVREVVICNVDPNPFVSGNGMEKLRTAGISVSEGLLRKEGAELNKRFFTAFEQKRPYIILKWAESADGFVSGKAGLRVSISNRESNRLVHRWRTEEDAIMVGFRTALHDNPRLNVRNWQGRNPVRIVTDRQLQLPGDLHLFDRTQPTIVINDVKASEKSASVLRYSEVPQALFYLKTAPESGLADMLGQLQQAGVQSLFVEGGPQLHRSFLESRLWDEIRRCQSSVMLHEGISAARPEGILRETKQLGTDLWTFYGHD